MEAGGTATGMVALAVGFANVVAMLGYGECKLGSAERRRNLNAPFQLVLAADSVQTVFSMLFETGWCRSAIPSCVEAFGFTIVAAIALLSGSRKLDTEGKANLAILIAGSTLWVVTQLLGIGRFGTSALLLIQVFTGSSEVRQTTKNIAHEKILLWILNAVKDGANVLTIDTFRSLASGFPILEATFSFITLISMVGVVSCMKQGAKRSAFAT